MLMLKILIDCVVDDVSQLRVPQLWTMRQMKDTVFLNSHDTHSFTFVVKISDLMDARKKSCVVGKLKKS